MQGEMIEVPDYNRQYLGFPNVAQYELDVICRVVNHYLEDMGMKLRIMNSMGEIVPVLEEI